MFGKILQEVFPRARNDTVARVNTREGPSENVASEGEGCDVTRGWTSVSIQIGFRRLTPDENSIVGARMRGQISSRLRRDASRTQPRPVFDGERNNRETQPRVR